MLASPTHHNQPDQCVDLDCVHIIQLFQSLLNLSLIRLDIHDENQSVVLLDFLHRALGVERVNDHLVCIEAWYMGNRFSWVLRRSGEDKGLWSMECGGEADFSSFLAVDLEECSASILGRGQIKGITYTFESGFRSLIRLRTWFRRLRAYELI